LYEDDATAAVRALTDDIARALHAVTLNLTQNDDLELVETADRLYTRAKGTHRWREREGMAERLPRLQRFARGLAWLRANDPARHARLARAVRRYQRALTLFGAAEGDVPPGYESGAVIRYIVREAAALLITLPFALAGTILWAPAYVLPRLVIRALHPPYEAVATYKVATGFAIAPLTVIACALAAGFLLTPWAAPAAAVVAPLLGLAAIAFHARWSRVREDARVFLRVLANRKSADRLAQTRTQLAGEFDQILDLAPHILDPSTP
jgi:hypothetical protein